MYMSGPHRQLQQHRSPPQRDGDNGGRDLAQSVRFGSGTGCLGRVCPLEADLLKMHQNPSEAPRTSLCNKLRSTNPALTA